MRCGTFSRVIWLERLMMAWCMHNTEWVANRTSESQGTRTEDLASHVL